MTSIRRDHQNLLRLPCTLVALLGLAGAGLADLINPVLDPGIPQSAGMQLKNHNFARRDLEQVREMGFRVIRKGMYWRTVEPVKGSYTFEEYDRLIDDAEELGLWVIGCLFGGNRDYEDTGEGGIQTEEGRKGYAGFAAALAERYAGRQVMWEIWNEPNVRTFWRRSGMHNSEPFADEYTALVKEVMQAVLAVDPDAFVMAGSVSNYWEPSYRWTEFCFQKGMLETGIRAWSVHPYGVRTPEEFAIGHGRTRDLLTQYGAPADFPMLNTERGFSVKQTDEGWSGGSQERAFEFQAWHFVRQSMVDLMNDVRLSVWYEWTSEEFGIFDGGGTRPIARAARVMLEELDGYRYQRRIKTRSERDYVLLFANGEGERMLVAWTSPPPGGTPEQAVERDISVVTGAAGDAVRVDLMGERQALESDGGTFRLTLSGAPQYVVLPRDAQLGEWTEPGERAAFEATRVDLKLFDGDVDWTFHRNNGDGAFEIGEDDGTPIGILRYDFTGSRETPIPYVLAQASVRIEEGPGEVQVSVRSPRRQRLTFRMVDHTGQTHQYREGVEGRGDWETVRIPLTRRLEHWGGANDGRIHFPIRGLTFNVPSPGEAPLAGAVEYGKAVAVRDPR